MEKLKSMTAFVLEQNKQLKNAPDAYGQYCKIVNHANFLSQTLNISMFVPAKLVDGEWVVLEEPSHYGKSIETTRETLKEYETAK